MRSDADVVVIGAGVAGLAAARVLARERLDVLVLEARDRCGGRVFPVPSPGASPPAELGAEFIHGPAPETRELLARSGGVAIEAGEVWVRDGADRLVKSERDLSAAGELLARARDLPRDESVERYLARFAGDDGARANVEDARLFAEGFDAADPAIASVWSIADEIRSGVDFASAWPSNGYAPILATLLDDGARAGARIALSSPVRVVRWRRGAVEVEIAGDARHTVAARSAILTLPVAVLRADEERLFEPALPSRTRAALRFLETGHVVKVVLRFAAPFLERIRGERWGAAAFFRDAAGPFATFWTRPGDGDQIAAWVGGPSAAHLVGASAGERIERALEQFGSLIGDAAGARAAFGGAETHNWTADPFARGAYSFVRTGGIDARSDLAAPVERTLFFAGEATAADGAGGTVNGALRTGERAAREALEALKQKEEAR